ncbi:hypothetical protein ABTY63_33295 [Streptomyces solisilvae]|uniref:hypothetical protein n=1 Tax=Streptomyces malaysiensis TaxID=92644 RepID=UPI00332D3D80
MQSFFDDQGRVERVDFIYQPETDDDGAHLIAEQGFAFFGPLSKLYTLRFLDAVTTDEGEIRALRDEPEPALLAQLAPEDYWAREDHVLQIWRFRQFPARGDSKIPQAGK